MKRLRIGLQGVGKIARDQHIPALRGSDAFELVACASRNATVEGVANFHDLAAMLEGRPDLDAVSVCTPPQAHYEAVKMALKAGKHVFLEKPPCTTLREFEELVALARVANRTLFQTWHSRYAKAVAPARAWLKDRTLRGGRVLWKENVRQWHPGQSWIWAAGGFGVFDPGINAISILTEIAPAPVFVRSAMLQVPSNCQSPIAADITFVTDAGAAIVAEFDFREEGHQIWTIELSTDAGVLELKNGGADLTINGKEIAVPDEAEEYPRLYGRFADLIRAGACDVDARPFQLVTDAFFVGARRLVEPFED
ncbi:MAG TPA: Gfo/Idh/MocA family oxidoreductase [Caulobacterales bacterium]|nr:Gfo/Idh/MocA family oxidoreductase [Caulobacterales bacterium]